MLKSIFIKNFAIIDELELDFHNGMSVLTGETGAGKSIIIDALNLTLGNRADRSVARIENENVEVVATIDAGSSAEAVTWLKEHDLDDGEECVLRRVISKDGKSKAYINSSPSSVTALRSLGNLFVDVYGQHEHQSLMRLDMQRQLLDGYASNSKHIEELATVFRRWQSLKNQLQSAENNQADTRAKLDLLRYQYHELEELNLKTDEFNEINEKFTLLNNSKDLNENSMRISQQLPGDNENSIYDSLSSLINDAEKYAAIDNKLNEPLEALRSIHIQIKEVANSLRNYSEKISSNPQELQLLEDRITAVEEISRKHKVKPNQLVAMHVSIKEELNSIESGHDDPEKIKVSMQEAEQLYRTTAKKISSARKKAANELNEKITESMQALGMQGGRFHINVEPKKTPELSLNGLDEIQFLVSTNPGQPLRMLNKVASGGELSRLSLAIQMATSNNLKIPTLIFDEVDTGVGGATAEIVGKHLRKLGNNAQVFCVTHLPQVAAQSHHHYKVNKFEKNESIATKISHLAEDERIEEIARMLGGVELTKNTQEHAEEMLRQSKL
ncbi:MAG: DNA repair protein RecN [Gammaproteobacteria bacterium]|nr:MAG: DNA repair protein RecN [Gammaproteobacteria bacterium]